MRYSYALDSLNFFLADVRQGLGPYLAVYLVSERHWSEDEIGILISIGVISALIAQTPAGALVDRNRTKRVTLVAAALAVAASSIIFPVASSFNFVAGLHAVAGAADTFFGPSIAAITLGIVGPSAFTRRIGRNEAFNHAGNAFGAAAAGLFASFWGPSVIFYFIAGMALLSMASVLLIPAESIDNERARGLHDGASQSRGSPSRLNVLLSDRDLTVFCICCILFHLANAAMLPLVGEKLALQDKSQSAIFISGCIITAQAVMVPMAILAGSKADGWGRRPFLLTAFAALPLRGCLCLVSDDRNWFFATQILDGIAAGLYLTLLPIVIADLTRGTGHYNLALGAVITAQNIGAALSTTLAGLVAVQMGYSAAFLVLAGIATAGLILCYFGMRETAGFNMREPGKTVPGLSAAKLSINWIKLNQQAPCRGNARPKRQ